MSTITKCPNCGAPGGKAHVCRFRFIAKPKPTKEEQSIPSGAVLVASASQDHDVWKCPECEKRAEQNRSRVGRHRVKRRAEKKANADR